MCCSVVSVPHRKGEESKIKLFGQPLVLYSEKKKTNTLHDITKSNSVDVKILVQIFHTVTDFEFISIKSPVASF